MNKSPFNYLITTALGAVLWVVFAILFGEYLSTNPTLAAKNPDELSLELQIFFGMGALLSILLANYWYYYGDTESTAGELESAKKKWVSLFITQIILSVVFIVVLVVINRNEGIEPKWYGIYYAIIALLTYLLFWLTTFFMSPRTVKYIPFGK